MLTVLTLVAALMMRPKCPICSTYQIRRVCFLSQPCNAYGPCMTPPSCRASLLTRIPPRAWPVLVVLHPQIVADVHGGWFVLQQSLGGLHHHRHPVPIDRGLVVHQMHVVNRNQPQVRQDPVPRDLRVGRPKLLQQPVVLSPLGQLVGAPCHDLAVEHLLAPEHQLIRRETGCGVRAPVVRVHDVPELPLARRLSQHPVLVHSGFQRPVEALDRPLGGGLVQP